MAGRFWALGAALALAACAAEEGADNAAAIEAVPAGESVAGPAATGPAQVGEGSQIRLDALTPAEIAQADLAGELGCSFVRGGRDLPLLVAMGFVGDADGRAQAVAKAGGHIEHLRAREPGGFDVLPRGASFVGRGMTYIVAPAGQGGRPAGGESPPLAAELLLHRADGAELVITGRWVCGP